MEYDQYYSWTIVVVCDASNTGLPAIVESQVIGQCAPSVTVSHVTGCPVSFLETLSNEEPQIH